MEQCQAIQYLRLVLTGGGIVLRTGSERHGRRRSARDGARRRGARGAPARPSSRQRLWRSAVERFRGSFDADFLRIRWTADAAPARAPVPVSGRRPEPGSLTSLPLGGPIGFFDNPHDDVSVLPAGVWLAPRRDSVDELGHLSGVH